VLCLPGGLATAPFYDDVLAEPALAASGVRAIATTLPGFGRVPFPPVSMPVSRHRPVTETRRVPIPAELVIILRQHIDTFGVAALRDA